MYFIDTSFDGARFAATLLCQICDRLAGVVPVVEELLLTIGDPPSDLCGKNGRMWVLFIVSRDVEANGLRRSIKLA